MSESENKPNRSRFAVCREWACWTLLAIVSLAFWVFVVWISLAALNRLL